KSDQNLGHDVSPFVIRPAGGVSDNVAASNRAKFWSDDENDGAQEKETPKNVKENAVPDTPEVDVRGEKEKAPENVMHSNASDTNTVVNSQFEE
ncbi:hypothetical protein A2U01_0074414, partial [Trifolium medium]|nr:hypothetical protein [Trifolium medium]